MRIGFRTFIVPLLAIATSMQAITYVVPSDRDLVKRAEAIVVATAGESHSELRDGRVVTVATLQVERVLKGSVGDSLPVVELGGAVGERFTFIPGSPRYEVAQRYLVFLRTNRFGEWTTYGFGLGKFKFSSDLQNREFLTRGGTEDDLYGFEESDGSQHVEPLRAADEFLSFVATTVKSDGPAQQNYTVDRSSVLFATFPEFTFRAERFIPVGLATRADYLSDGNFRWESPTASFVYCCDPNLQPGFSGPSDASSAMANWNSAGAGVNYTLGGVDNTADKGFTAHDCKNTVLFNDPNNEITGAAAIGGISATGSNCVPPPGQVGGPFTYTLGDGVTYNKTLEVDVVVGKNGTFSTNEATFIGVLTHELGHTLGFRHSDQTGANDPRTPCDPALIPCTSDAVMNSVIAFNLQTLRPYDTNAVQTVYGAGPVCTNPAITGQPSGVTINSGQQTTLSVTATGTSPTYQWYVGNPPSTTTPAANGTGSQLMVSPTTTTTYWVRVSGCGTSVDSRAATVTVNPAACVPPSVPAPNASPSSILSGQSSMLTASPSGTGPFTYQWHTGTSGVVNPIAGAISSSIIVSPTVTTSYWVRVTGQCAPTADSPSTTVVVQGCVPPSVGAPNASPSSIATGQSSTLSVNPGGTGPFSYQWFTGNSGITTSPIGGATSSFVTVSPTTTTSYWVRVTGQCAPTADSPATTVTVTCSPIASGSLSAQPSTINSGQSSTLSFATAGSGPFTIQWYLGFSGDTTNPINGATTTSTTVSPTATTAYWVRVTSPCGTQDASVFVFVNGTVCTAPSITTQPASSTISAGTPVTLSVIATGTAPLTFQWYTGDKPDVTHPIAGATTSSTTQSPLVTTKYWVRVSNSCNGTQNADSNTATITVSTCTNPSITTQPANVSVPIATAATLKVVAAGTALHYAWFEGVKGNTSKPTGAPDSATFVSGAISGNTSFWVRVTGACGNPVDSNAAIVTATAPPRGRAVRH
jgi:hypothetical protein